MDTMNSNNKLRVKIAPNFDPTQTDNRHDHSRLASLSEEQNKALVEYLVHRLRIGQEKRQARVSRYIGIDRKISTWKKHTALDSKRLDHEDETGQQTVVSDNLPILAARLEDMVAFYADTLSPVGNPIVTTELDQSIQDIVKRVTQDILARDYYGEVAMACRTQLKYNIGGMFVDWDYSSKSSPSVSGIQSAGNVNKAIDPYNTFWDPSVQRPEDVSIAAEWAAMVSPVNTLFVYRMTLNGEWYQGERAIHGKDRVSIASTPTLRLWIDPARVLPTDDGADSRSDSDSFETVDWSTLGLSLPSDTGIGLDETNNQFERVTIFAWICPHAHGLLNDDDRAELAELGAEPESYLELWRFELINSTHLVVARPQSKRASTSKGESSIIPLFMSHLTRDTLGASQRSHMELNVPFQRFASSMYGIGTSALRRRVWGRQVIDPQMFNVSDFTSGAATGPITSKTPGRDVRSGMMPLSDTSGAEQAFGFVNTGLQLMDTLYPSQALPAQVAGLDRAVTNQVSAVVHGAQRALRMSLRQLDSVVFMRARMECVRNLQRFEALTIEAVSDEVIAKALGSGVESMEAERITEALWRVLMAIIQNQEAMQAFDVPKMLGYLSEVLRIKVDMSTFARQPPPQQPQQAAAGLAPEQLAALQAQQAQQQQVDPAAAAVMNAAQ